MITVLAIPSGRYDYGGDLHLTFPPEVREKGYAAVAELADPRLLLRRGEVMIVHWTIARRVEAALHRAWPGFVVTADANPRYAGGAALLAEVGR